jgi:hypothetical protein
VRLLSPCTLNDQFHACQPSDPSSGKSRKPVLNQKDSTMTGSKVDCCTAEFRPPQEPGLHLLGVREKAPMLGRTFRLDIGAGFGTCGVA